MTRLTATAMWLMGRGDEASCAEVARHLPRLTAFAQALLATGDDPRGGAAPAGNR
jgi:hypothetical protein